jgi:methylthioribose-1-phosphate isomerase
VSDGKLRSLRYLDGEAAVSIIDQTRLPHQLEFVELRDLQEFCRAIETMQVRGAPLIGITAAFGLALEIRRDPAPQNEQLAVERLLATRPTAVNLRWALDEVRAAIAGLPPGERAARAIARARQLAEEDVSVCREIGRQGLGLLQRLAAGKGREQLNVLTHCNAGWLATLEWGTALAPVYAAREAGLPVHVWVSETRPRNQGLNLTTWELAQAGISHTAIADNAAGHLMQQGRVDCCIVGSDRTVANGDVCNKVGTYLKALAARESGVPFYVALPVSTIDWDCESGAQIPIEERGAEELLVVEGLAGDGAGGSVTLGGTGTPVYNPAFDVTPASLVTRLITERGVIPAQRQALAALRAKVSAAT